MPEEIRSLVLLAATVATGLMAGLYFAFSCAVMPALRRVDDRTFVEVMRRVNTAILNGWFGLAFGGALVLGAVSVGLHRSGAARPALPWVIWGFVLYALSFLITLICNVPLNNQLADTGEPGTPDDPGRARRDFEPAWVRWNLIRTLLCTGALGCLGWALRTAALAVG